MSRDSSLFTSSLHPSPEPFHGESDMKPYRGDKPILERLLESPLPSLNRIGQDRADAAAEIERLRREINDIEYGRTDWKAKAEAAESLLAAAWEALKPFVDAYEAAGYGGGAPDYFDIWESTAAISITFGDLRKAAALRAAGKEVSERNSTQKDGSR